MSNQWLKNNSIEAFFDLVFVALFIQLNEFLVTNYSLGNFYIYTIILLWIYWIWVWYTVYHERLSIMLDEFEKKTLFFKIIILWFIWVSIPWILSDTTEIFIILFVLARLLLLILRIRAYKKQPDIKGIAKDYVIWFSIWIWIWLSSLFFDSLFIQAIIWSLAIFSDLLTSIVAEKKWKKQWTLYTKHYFERFSLLTLIAIWELIIVIVKRSYEFDLNNYSNIVWIIVLFFIVYWIYKKYFDEFYEAKTYYDIKKIHAYNYLHFLIIFSIMLVWLGFSLAIWEYNLYFFQHQISLIAIWLWIFILTIRVLENFLWYRKLSIRRWFVILSFIIAWFLIYIFEINNLWIFLIFAVLWFEIFLKTKNKNNNKPKTLL